MVRNWLKAHRSLVATVTSGVVIAAIVATIAVVSTGYTAQKIGDTVYVVHRERVPPVLPGPARPVVGVEDHVLDPQPTEVERRRQPGLTGPDHD